MFGLFAAKFHLSVVAADFPPLEDVDAAVRACSAVRGVHQTGAPVQEVVRNFSEEIVSVLVAVEVVIAEATMDFVAPILTLKDVLTVAAEQLVVARSAAQQVSAFLTSQNISITAGSPVAFLPTVEGVVAQAAEEVVDAVLTVDVVVVREAVKVVLAVTAA